LNHLNKFNFLLNILNNIILYIIFNDDAFTQGGTTYLKGKNYQTEEDYELNGGNQKFNIKEIEVYEIELK